MRDLGFFLIAAGVIAVIAGVLLISGAGNWLGRLPGDLRWEGKNFQVFAPIGTSILLSLGLTAVLWLLRLFQR